ncbi:MAG: DUF2254 domain-containing protein [Deltaproteobacteria bacterium]|nr:DUF2254 domain-containing protein [Deltaproteobacteria bacterium]
MRLNPRLTTAWFWLRASYWFVPTLITLAAVAMALGLIALDRAVAQAAEVPAWVYSGSAEGARALLSAVASSMVTVAGVVFSITMVALALTSSQFGPRLLLNFMRDTGNQVVIGVFIATFMYCLVVLRVVRGGSPEFVPHIAVTVALILAATAVMVLIYFIHHVSVSIQADHVIAAVRGELCDAIDAQLAGAADGPGRPSAPPPPEGEATRVAAPRGGYVQAIDSAALLRLARTQDLRIHLACRAGHFVVAGAAIAHAWPAARAEPVAASLRGAFLIGAQRTPTQDPEFAVRQLVEVAVRALSPGINDPFTAMACVDWLAESLCRLAAADPPGAAHDDGDGTPRLILQPVRFAGVVDAAYNQIRQYGRGSAAVTIRLLEALQVIATHARRDGDRAALRRHVDMVERGAAALPEPFDRAAVRERAAAARAALDGTAP